MGVINQKGKIQEAMTGLIGDTVKGTIGKGIGEATKGLKNQIDALSTFKTSMSQFQSGITQWKQSMIQQVHDKFSTLNNISATIHRFDQWEDDDDPDRSMTLEEKILSIDNKIKTMNRKIRRLQTSVSSPRKETETPVQTGTSDPPATKTELEALRNSVKDILSKLSPLSAKKSIDILKHNGDFDQLDEFALDTSQRLRDLQNRVDTLPLGESSGSGIRVLYNSGPEPMHSYDFPSDSKRV